MLLMTFSAIASIVTTTAMPGVGAQPADPQLVDAMTAEDADDGGNLRLTSISPFEASGGSAIIDPGGFTEEVVTYRGIDESSSTLIDISRPNPVAHEAGTAVRAAAQDEASTEGQAAAEREKERERHRSRAASRVVERERGRPRATSQLVEREKHRVKAAASVTTSAIRSTMRILTLLRNPMLHAGSSSRRAVRRFLRL